MRRTGLIWFLAGLTITGCGAAGTEEGGLGSRALINLPVPEEHREGAAVFAARCTVCHGRAATGTRRGPPLVHITYEPSHHGDDSFRIAVARGVLAHHWRFGNMPPIAGVPPEDVDRIIGYVRWLQREAGIE